MADECLARGGIGQVSKEKLAEAAAAAEANGFPHGVSARATPGITGEQLAVAFSSKKFVESTVEALELAGFPVHRTPTAVDPFHVTIALPKPVTEEAAKRFNSLFSAPKVKSKSEEMTNLFNDTARGDPLMSNCCQNLTALCPTPSPFGEKIILNWYDGPLEGIVRCMACSRDYYFRDLAEDEESGVRIYGLFNLPTGTLERVRKILPREHPIWKFDSTAAKTAADKVINKVQAEAQELVLVLATEDFTEILACRSTDEVEDRASVDWTRFLFDVTSPVEAV